MNTIRKLHCLHEGCDGKVLSIAQVSGRVWYEQNEVGDLVQCEEDLDPSEEHYFCVKHDTEDIPWWKFGTDFEEDEEGHLIWYEFDSMDDHIAVLG